MPSNTENTNLTFYRSTTAIHIFLVKDENGAAYDLTGFEVKCQARQSPDSDTTVFDLTLEDETNGSIFENGKVVLRVEAAIVADMPPQCMYDIIATLGEFVVPIGRGFINLIPNITR